MRKFFSVVLWTLLPFLAFPQQAEDSSGFERLHGDFDVAPSLLFANELEYPTSFRQVVVRGTKVQNPPIGEVVVIVTISPEGLVNLDEVTSSTHEDFTKVVIPYVKTARFSPPLKNDSPVSGRFRWRITVPPNSLLTDLDSSPQLLQSPHVTFPPGQKKEVGDDGWVTLVPVEGRVVLEVMIKKDGRVSVLKVISASHQDFVNPAKHFARGSLFTTPTAGGKPVDAILRWPLVFRK